jgi:hypothetical protein
LPRLIPTREAASEEESSVHHGMQYSMPSTSPEGHDFQRLRRNSQVSYQGAPSGAPYQHENQAGFSRRPATPSNGRAQEGHELHTLPRFFLALIATDSHLLVIPARERRETGRI